MGLSDISNLMIYAPYVLTPISDRDNSKIKDKRASFLHLIWSFSSGTLSLLQYSFVPNKQYSQQLNTYKIWAFSQWCPFITNL